jgi:hypothetical protein
MHTRHDARASRVCPTVLSSPDVNREITDTSGAVGFIGIFRIKVHTGRFATLDSPALMKNDGRKTCLAPNRVSLDNLDCAPIARNPDEIQGKRRTILRRGTTPSC